MPGLGLQGHPEDRSYSPGQGSLKLAVLRRKGAPAPRTLEFSFLGSSHITGRRYILCLASDFLLHAYDSHFSALGSLLWKIEAEEVPPGPWRAARGWLRP